MIGNSAFQADLLRRSQIFIRLRRVLVKFAITCST